MTISIPHSFSNGSIAEASEVNANFNEVASFVNALEDGTGLNSGSITTSKLADLAVSSAKLGASSVTTTKISDLNVTTAKLADASITTAKLVDTSVTGAKLANWASSTKTGSYVLVAADRNTRVVMNSASNTTITVNTSLFSAGDVVEILNIGTGICTITAGTATVTSSGSLALGQWSGGTLYFTSASSAIFFGSQVTVEPGLSLVSSTTIGSAVSTVTVNNAFSSAYDNYKILISGGTTSTNLYLLLTFGSTSTGYYNVVYYVLTPAGNEIVNNNGGAISFAASGGTNGLNGCIEVISPNLAKHTHVMASHWFYDQGGAGFSNGYVANTTQYSAFTLTTNTGTMTGGTIKVYGYKN